MIAVKTLKTLNHSLFGHNCKQNKSNVFHISTKGKPFLAMTSDKDLCDSRLPTTRTHRKTCRTGLTPKATNCL